MCCDWFDVLVGMAGGFFLGCLATAFLAKAIMEESARQQVDLHARTELKDRNCGL